MMSVHTKFPIEEHEKVSPYIAKASDGLRTEGARASAEKILIINAEVRISGHGYLRH